MRRSPYLLPPSATEWLPEGHLAYFILDLVEDLDLAEIERMVRAKAPAGAAWPSAPARAPAGDLRRFPSDPFVQSGGPSRALPSNPEATPEHSCPIRSGRSRRE